MHKLISDLTPADKAKFLNETKQAMTKQYGIPRKIIASMELHGSKTAGGH